MLFCSVSVQKTTLFICLSYVICHTIATLVHGTSVETRNRGRLHNSALLNGFSVALSKTGFPLLPKYAAAGDYAAGGKVAAIAGYTT